ncbi:pyridoxamine 5'-phosphate oxidase family protein [Ruminococcaceae bacterium OttesenSCG-928-D13]|nr:pyridoxamine 5'-phosphate oxidase family protein [Ruminococcaceae bacterium OttesenSCG-928-D13]
MFREMRRKKQLLSAEDCAKILTDGSNGVLAVHGDDGYPYTVPLSYVYHNDKIYFHCAKAGHKLDAIARDAKVSFCVVDRDEVVPAEATTYFRSVVAFGRARVLTDMAEMRGPIQALAAKYMPGLAKAQQAAIDKEAHLMAMVEITVDHLTGKEAIELTRAKQG